MIPEIIVGILVVWSVINILHAPAFSEVNAASTLIYLAIYVAALAFGGFWSAWHWQQWVVALWFLFVAVVNVANDGEFREIDVSTGIGSILMVLFIGWVVYSSGFFSDKPSSPTDTIGEQERLVIPNADYVTIIKTPTSTTYIVNTPSVEKP